MSIAILLIFSLTGLASVKKEARLLNENINAYFLNFESNQGMRKIGRKIQSQAFQLINDPGRFNQLSEGEKQRLSLNYAKLNRVIVTSNVLEGCIDKNKLLADKTMSILLQASVYEFCDDDMGAWEEFVKIETNLITLDNDLHQVENKLLEAEVAKSLDDQTLKNAIETYLFHKAKYSDSFLSGTLGDDEIKTTLTAFCEKSDCSKERKKKIKQYINELAPKVRENVHPRLDIEQARFSLNNKLSQMNVEIKKWRDSKGEDLTSFINFQKIYMQTVSKNEGLLLRTSVIEKLIEGPDFNKLDPSEIKPFKLIKAKDKNLRKFASRIENHPLNRAINEITSSMIKMADNNQAHKNEDWDDLKKALVHNIPATSVVISKNPSYAKLVCKGIQELEHNQLLKDELASVSSKAGMVVGGLLVVSGVFSWAGVGLISATTLSAAVAAGTTAGILEGAVIADNLKNDYYEMIALKQSFLASGEYALLDEVSKAEKSFKENRFDLALSVGFAAAELGAFKKLLPLVKNSKSVKLLNGLNDVTKKLLQGDRAQALKNALKHLGQGGVQKLDELLGYVARTGMTDKFLETIDLLKDNGKALARYINRVLYAGRELCIIY